MLSDISTERILLSTTNVRPSSKKRDEIIFFVSENPQGCVHSRTKSMSYEKERG